MPDYIFHIEIGDEFLSNTEKEIRDILNKNYNAFLLGLQGPDIFYYRAFFPGKNKKISKIVAEGLHKEKFSQYAYLILNGMKYFQGYLKVRSEKDLLFAYFTGFFTHLFTDLFFHPYIRYKTELYKRKYRTIWLHKKFEMNLDYAYVFSKNRRFSALEYVNKFKSTKGFSQSISLFFSRILKETYALDMSICNISLIFGEAYRIMDFVLSFFEAKNPIKVRMIYPIIYFFLTGNSSMRFLTHPDREEFEDVLNQKHSPWTHLELSREYTFSVLELREMLIDFLIDNTEKIYNFVYKNSNEYPEIFMRDYHFSKGVIYGNQKYGEEVSWFF